MQATVNTQSGLSSPTIEAVFLTLTKLWAKSADDKFIFSYFSQKKNALTFHTNNIRRQFD